MWLFVGNFNRRLVPSNDNGCIGSNHLENSSFEVCSLIRFKHTCQTSLFVYAFAIIVVFLLQLSKNIVKFGASFVPAALFGV